MLTNAGGELAALAAAALWAIASVVYGFVGNHIPPLGLNSLKGIVAIALLIFTILVTGESLPTSTPTPIFLLCLSGVIGISWGDTAFMGALNYLGPRRVLLIGTLSPPITAILSIIWLGESLNIRAWCGIIITILGVAWVITEPLPSSNNHPPTHLWRGIGLGLLAAITNAIATVIARVAFTTGSISSLWAALFRLSAAQLILFGWLWFPKGQAQALPHTSSKPSWRVIFAACFGAFCGTYLGIWLQQTAIKFTAAGIASTLLQTSPLFVIPIAICIGEKVSWRGMAGVMIAIIGIGLLFFD
ncbi:DMT family transporter [Anabaenopsis arnoldii]|uniref:DMT family transporter n=1 Tax=Anabaenopsis arnoldii TaxID=2152938 RepID=A0ABT5ANB0_9CYAN|nr:DMT family transporter [Anabaenopsis arnoldii]MDB9538797.1 DMT family transporter [Anabaenopsis arnoldii]MDH6091074.1 DMT family transporter [Anabaenopsis arnoldii]